MKGHQQGGGVLLFYLYPSLDFSLSALPSLSSLDIQNLTDTFVLQVGYTVTKDLFNYVRESEKYYNSEVVTQKISLLGISPRYLFSLFSV
jgi:hypothetical protein